MRSALVSIVLLVLAYALPAAAAAATCAEAVVGKVQCSNAAEVCKLLLGERDPDEGVNFDGMFEFRVQELGDGAKGYVFAKPAGGDAYSVAPNFHFTLSGDRLELYFDGRGVPGSYLTDRPKVNGRFQIERVSRADIPGIYKNREAERWFWTGKEYAKAFTRRTVEQAKDSKLNGTETVWEKGAEAAFRNAKGSGGNWTHTVVAGDTLGGIAGKYGVSMDEIMRQNDIRSAASLRLGQKIRYEGWRINAR